MSGDPPERTEVWNESYYKKGSSARERWLLQKGAIFLGPLPGWKLCGILGKGWGLEPNKPVFELRTRQLLRVWPWASYLN